MHINIQLPPPERPMRFRALVVTSALCLIVASPLHADYREWLNQCSPGAFKACASVAIHTVYNPVTQTTLIGIKMANLQGANDWLPNTGPTTLYSARFDNMIADHNTGMYEPWCDPSSPNCGVEYLEGVSRGHSTGDVLISESEISGTFNDYAGPAGGGIVRFTFWNMPGPYGCDHPDYDPQTWWGNPQWTCNGYIFYYHKFIGRWAPTEATTVSLSMRAQDSEGNWHSASCRTGVDCVTVTPEPFTIVLLGSGLAAMGGVGAIRRRRKRGGEMT